MAPKKAGDAQLVESVDRLSADLEQYREALDVLRAFQGPLMKACAARIARDDASAEMAAPEPPMVEVVDLEGGSASDPITIGVPTPTPSKTPTRPETPSEGGKGVSPVSPLEVGLDVAGLNTRLRAVDWQAYRSLEELSSVVEELDSKRTRALNNEEHLEATLKLQAGLISSIMEGSLSPWPLAGDPTVIGGALRSIPEALLRRAIKPWRDALPEGAAHVGKVLDACLDQPEAPGGWSASQVTALGQAVVAAWGLPSLLTEAERKAAFPEGCPPSSLADFVYKYLKSEVVAEERAVKGQLEIVEAGAANVTQLSESIQALQNSGKALRSVWAELEGAIKKTETRLKEEGHGL